MSKCNHNQRIIPILKSLTENSTIIKQFNINYLQSILHTFMVFIESTNLRCVRKTVYCFSD